MQAIDVIIPVYNGEKWIGATLRAVTRQTVVPQQIIVVDDGSHDGSLRIAAEFPGVKIVQNPQPGSPSRARNFGLLHAQAPLVAFLDQDDVWHPLHLQILATLLEKCPESAAAAARYREFRDEEFPEFDMSDTTGRKIHGWEAYPFGGDMEPSLILFRRTVFDRLEWADDTDGCSDRLLFHQLLVHHPVIRCEARSVARRVHSESYYQSLIRCHPVKHFRRLARLSERLLNYYVRYLPDEREFSRVALRSGIMGLIADIIEAVLAKDRSALQAAAAALEGILAVDHARTAEKTIEQLFVFMTHHNAGLQEEVNTREFCEYMCAHWPEDCPVTGRLVRQRTIHCRPGIGFYVGHILRHPLRLRCYNLFGEALRTRLRPQPQPVVRRTPEMSPTTPLN